MVTLLTEDSRSVASKLFAILNFVSDDPSGGSTLSEIAAGTGLPLSTTHRLVAEWVHWGGLSKSRDGGYAIGARIWEVGMTSPSIQTLRSAAMPFLEDLHNTTKQHAQLAILQGEDALYIEKLSSRNSAELISRPGIRLPLHATGVGLVLLAHSGNHFVDSFLRKELPVFTPRTVVDPDEIRQRLEEIRTRGYVRTEEELHLGVTSVAAPVRDRRGTTVAAMSVVVPLSLESPTPLETLVQWGALGTSRVLGFQRTRDGVDGLDGG